MTYNLELRVEFIGKLSSLAHSLQPPLEAPFCFQFLRHTFENIAAKFFSFVRKGYWIFESAFRPRPLVEDKYTFNTGPKNISEEYTEHASISI